jgi:D-alanyl-D-alanine carboxypeptidase
MATKRHQFILGLLVKKMREIGCKITAIDGDYPGMFGEDLPTPPTILRHRPDIIAVKVDGQICIGEAKTEDDIDTQRTLEQLQDFGNLKLNGKLCEVFIGIPKSSKLRFQKILTSVNLDSARNIHPFFIPDDIINE